MKKLVYCFVLMSLTLTFCKKQESFENVSGITMQELNIPANFDWKMAHPVTFHVTGASGQFVEITTADGTITLHKCSIIPGTTTTEITITLPDFFREVKINDIPVPLSGSDIYVTIPLLKDLLLINYALSFDGVDDYVDLGDITQLNNVAAFSIEGWANQTTNTDTEVIFYKVSDASNDITLYTSGGTMYIDLGNGSDSYATWASYSATITSGTWFHWAVVYDGGGVANANRLKLYINGNATPITLAFTGTIPATTSSSLSSNNAQLSTTANPFGGYMDEVRVWSVARSGANINSYYNKIISGSTTNLVASWRMDEGTGTSLEDETSNSYDATITGCSWALYVNAWDSDGDGVTDLNDDYPLDDTRAFDNFMPTTDYGTLAFEDLWPSYGDYDFNDLILGYRFKTVTNASNEVVEIFGTFIVRANGAAMHNGFGFELPDAVAGVLTNVEVTGYLHTQGIITINGTTKLESGQTNPVVIAFDDTYDLMDGLFNTIIGGETALEDSVTIQIEVTGGGPFTAANFSLDTWNPFIFIHQIRGRELHQLDYVPTDLMTTSYFGTNDDASVPGTGDYYKTSGDLPWVLDIPTSFSYPSEYNDINAAFLHFTAWAESGGALYTDWYSNTAAGYRNNTYIYAP